MKEAFLEAKTGDRRIRDNVKVPGEKAVHKEAMMKTVMNEGDWEDRRKRRLKCGNWLQGSAREGHVLIVHGVIVNLLSRST